MTKQPVSFLVWFRQILPTFVFVFLALHSLSQTDTSKTNNTVTDSIKYGYGRAIINGRGQKIPMPALKDSDGDGVPDQFDLEPNTPRGVKVDMHGRALDTDGDGVPDYRDKEKLTPQRCFPVDSNGVGKCPEQAPAKTLRKVLDSTNAGGVGFNNFNCHISSLPSIRFKDGSAALTSEAIMSLDSAAGKLTSNPTCQAKIFISKPKDSKLLNLQTKRANAIIQYLAIKQNIASSRITAEYDDDSDHYNSLDIVPISSAERSSNN